MPEKVYTLHNGQQLYAGIDGTRVRNRFYIEHLKQRGFTIPPRMLAANPFDPPLPDLPPGFLGDLLAVSPADSPAAPQPGGDVEMPDAGPSGRKSPVSDKRGPPLSKRPQEESSSEESGEEEPAATANEDEEEDEETNEKPPPTPAPIPGADEGEEDDEEADWPGLSIPLAPPLAASSSSDDDSDDDKPVARLSKKAWGKQKAPASSSETESDSSPGSGSQSDSDDSSPGSPNAEPKE